MNIKNKNLLINKCYVNGAWVSSDKKIKVINPATGDLIAEVPNFGKKETINAIDAAELAFKLWSKFTAHERSKILKKWYDLVIDNQDDLATIMTVEQRLTRDPFSFVSPKEKGERKGDPAEPVGSR